MNGLRELVFFTYRDLGRQFPAALRQAGLQIEQHDDHFGPETLDEEWIGEIGRRGWVAVTRDARIRYSPPRAQRADGIRHAAVCPRRQTYYGRGSGDISEVAREDCRNGGRRARAFHSKNPTRWGTHMASTQGLGR